MILKLRGRVWGREGPRFRGWRFVVGRDVLFDDFGELLEGFGVILAMGGDPIVGFGWSG